MESSDPIFRPTRTPCLIKGSSPLLTMVKFSYRMNRPSKTGGALGCVSSMRIPLQPKHTMYMVWHRKHIFKD